MASIISVDTLQDSAGSNEITTANVKTAFDQRVKAWIHYNGSSATIAESHNISSATDNGTGDYTATINSNMSSSTYVVMNFVAGGDDRRAAHSARDELVAGSWNLICRSAVVADSNALTDENKVMGATFGDLA